MPRDTYLRPYRDAHKRYGSDFRATLWANERSQQTRFEVMAQMCFLQGKRIVDAGCSRGDFAAHLIEHGIEYGRFVGIDGISQIIDYANDRGLPRAEFHCGDFVRQTDLLSLGDPQVIAISGALNTMDDRTIKAVLKAAWRSASETLIFNFLSDRTGRAATTQDDPARRLDTLKMLDWALQTTWHVQFRQDYFKHGHDATIMMRKM